MTHCEKCGQQHTGCTGHISSGERKGQPCRKPCRPGEVCTAHGGRAPQVKAAQERRRQEAAAAAEVARLGQSVEIDPSEALIELVHWTAGEVRYWRRIVADLEDRALTWGTTKVVDKAMGPEETREASPHVAYRMLTAASDRLAQYAAAALRAGVEERRVRLAEQQGDLVAEVIRRILDALNLSPEQQALVPTIVPQQLRLIAGGAA